MKRYVVMRNDTKEFITNIGLVSTHWGKEEYAYLFESKDWAKKIIDHESCKDIKSITVIEYVMVWNGEEKFDGTT
jgi:hypothetical protein